MGMVDGGVLAKCSSEGRVVSLSVELGKCLSEFRVVNFLAFHEF